jgi:predicted membrane chloride channel (bestrophin family)
MNRFLRILKFVVIAVLALTVFGFVVMQLWNWLTPTLFGWHVITFWQALGILILSKILFGGFRGRPGPHRYWRHRMMERWAQMSPEEREKFRRSIQGRCGHFGPPTAEAKS